MSSIVTDELLHTEESTSDEINELVRTVEEKTLLQQRRSMAVRVKLQELSDRRNKLDAQRLDRLADYGVNVDLKGIKDEVQKSIQEEKERYLRERQCKEMDEETNAEDISPASPEIEIQNTPAIGVTKNPDDQNRLGKVIGNLQNNQKQFDKENKTPSSKQRQSFVTSTQNRTMNQTNEARLERRSSLTPGGPRGSQKPPERRSSLTPSGPQKNQINSGRQNLLKSAGAPTQMSSDRRNSLTSGGAIVKNFERRNSLINNGTLRNNVERRNSLTTGGNLPDNMQPWMSYSFTSGLTPKHSNYSERRDSINSIEANTSSNRLGRRNSLTFSGTTENRTILERRKSITSTSPLVNRILSERRNSLTIGDIPTSNMPLMRRNSLTSGGNMMAKMMAPERRNSLNTTKGGNRKLSVKSSKVKRRSSFGGSFQSEKSKILNSLTAPLENREFRKASKTISNALKFV